MEKMLEDSYFGQKVIIKYFCVYDIREKFKKF